MVYRMNIDPLLRGRGVKQLDGDFSKVELVDYTRDGGMLNNTLGSGRPVKTDFMPTRMLWDEAAGPIPDFNRSLALNISEQAKAFIERLEPGVHQFIPVDYVRSDGKLLEKRWFLVVCHRIDSTDHDRTTFVMIENRNADGSLWDKHWLPVYNLVANGQLEKIPPNLPHDTESKLVFSKKNRKSAVVDGYVFAE
jgi:Immunity protein family (Imm11)